MSSSMKAAIHLGQNYLANLEVYKNTNFEEIQSLVNITQKLILEHSEEILNVHTIESTSLSWTRSTLSHDQVILWTKAEVRVYPDSVLFIKKMYDNRDAKKDGKVKWKNSKCLFPTKNCWESMENQFNSNGRLSPEFSSLQILQEIPHDMRERNIEPENFEVRIIFMSMCNNIDWTRKGNDGICISISEKVEDYAKRFSQGHWTFLGPGDEKKWYETLPYTPEGKWDSTATQMVERFKDTGF